MGSWFSKKHDSSDDSDNDVGPEEGRVNPIDRSIDPDVEVYSCVHLPVDVLKTDLGDQLAMSHFLNDRVLEYFQEKGYKINFKWDNLKMLAMFVGAILCAINHAKLIPFPKDRYFSMVLIFMYVIYPSAQIYAIGTHDKTKFGRFFAMSTIAALHLYFIEKDIIVTAKAKKVR